MTRKSAPPSPTGSPCAADKDQVTAQAGLPSAARRALKEAQARRTASKKNSAPAEIGGPGGPEPTRYGDWETRGIASDF